MDKGEEYDWFGSHFIVTMAVIFACSFVGMIIWELRTDRPLMDLRLFERKNFAVCAFLMLLTGGFLNATTVLQPQFLCGRSWDIPQPLPVFRFRAAGLF